MKHWEFPINTADFLQYQEQLSGRKLNDFEREYTSEAVEIINDAYEDGKAGITTQLYPHDPEEYLTEMDEQLHFSAKRKPVAKSFVTALCRLCTGAWERGREDARKALLS